MFDPLSFFTAQPASEVETSVVFEISKEEFSSVEEEEPHILITTLDLPPPAKTSDDTLIAILTLLQPDEKTNFETHTVSFEEQLKQRNLKLEDLQKVLPQNLYDNCEQVLRLRSDPAIQEYYTRILATTSSETITNIVSLRIAEGCGRTALPQFTRRIKIDGIDDILLQEPSLTSDNLGLKTWGSSLILGEKFVNNHSDMLTNDPVLELGAGTGLVGIAIGILGYDITLTDLPEIVPNLKANLELNHVSGTAKVLDWTSFDEWKGQKFKNIVVADPIYSDKHPYWLVDVIDHLLDKQGVLHILIPIRPKFAEEREILWGLLNKYTQVSVETHHGYDDFGPQEYIYKKYINM